MIFVECNVIDMKTNKLKGKYHKSFDAHDDFNKWYAIVKTDCDTIMNIMKYNPNEKPGLKLAYDARLLKVSRENAT